MIRVAQRSAGFTLIELLVAMALGLLMVSATIMFFASNKQHFLVQQEATRLQENQRFAVQFLTRDIQGAGYRGCAGGSDGPVLNMLNDETNLENNFEPGVTEGGGIEGFDDVPATLPTPLANLFATASITPNEGPDVLVVRGPEGDSIGLSAITTSTYVDSNLVSQEAEACTGDIDRINGICPGDYLLISDCQKARIFQTDAIDATGRITHPETTGSDPGNAVGTWVGTNSQFDTDSEIVRYGTYTYFISDDGPSREPALYRKTNTDPAEELVEGVEDMQILYGENTDGDAGGTPNVFVTAAGVTDWGAVVAVRIELLLRGAKDNMAENELQVTFNGSTVPDDNKRLRKTAVLTASLRNRLP